MASKKPSTGKDVESIEKEFFGSRDDHPEDRSVTSRERARDQLQNEIEAFMARGGKIDKVDSHVTADPPKKPNSNYGSRPI